MEVAYSLNDGDTEKAENFTDCSIYQFYHRMAMKLKYSKSIEQKK